MAKGKADFHKGAKDPHTEENSNNRKLGPAKTQTSQPSIKCPECSSTRIWKDGLRYPRSNDKPIQRYQCRECGYRFSETTKNKHSNSYKHSEHDQKLHTLILKTPEAYLYNCQVGVAQQKGTKNLVEVESRIERWAAGATTTAKPTSAKIKGKLVELAWWMKKQGYADQSIRTYLTCLRILHAQGANLYDPESVKDALARQKWSNNRKRIAINAYTLFLKMNGLHWEKPKCKVTRKIPFIPTEQELDALIAGCGRKTATFLQLLKETAMRSGEAKRLLWTDVDFEKRVITLNQPEKGGNPRIWKVSPELIAMLNALPKQSLRVFGDGPINSLKTTFLKARKRLAAKLQNPRLLKISFHTFRHWKATMVYHKTKDPMYVKEFLGHKKLDTTLLYIQIEQALYSETNDDFIVKVARTPQQIKALLEVGFEYVCQKEDLLFFRKRK